MLHLRLVLHLALLLHLAVIQRNHTSQYSDVNDAVWEWFKKKTEQRIPVDGPIIQEFATKAAEKLGYPEFKVSSGWLTRFKECNNLSQHKLCHESPLCQRLQCTLGKSVLGLLSLDIRCKTSGTWMKLSAFTVHCRIRAFWRKQRNAFFVSATGYRRKPVVIGKYANPRCLKNINKDDLPCQYLNQQKAWMTYDILHKLLSQLNSSLKAQNRSILLFIDSAGCHPYDLKGRYSKLQPLDLGIIQNFKVHYRKLLLRHIITMTTDHDSATDMAKTLDVLQGLRSRTIPLSNVLQQLEFPALSQKQLPSVL